MRISDWSSDVCSSDLGLCVVAVLLVLAHASVEAGRGVIASGPARRSAVRAWGRGFMLLLRRPVATLLVYLGTTLVGYGLALGFGLLRVQVSGSGWLALLIGLLLTQLQVASIAWGRSARLYATFVTAHVSTSITNATLVRRILLLSQK